MSSALRRLAQQVPAFSRALKTSSKSLAEGGSKEWSHVRVVHGDGHVGLRPGYKYDYEHGPHYFDPSKMPNLKRSYRIFWAVMWIGGFGFPFFVVWYTQNKAKA